VVLGGYKAIDMPNVFCLPMIRSDELPKYYKMADAMIHLCWLDCCPNSVIEGLASGLPVLCSHNGGTKELVKDDGIIIQIEDDYRYGDMVPLYSPPEVDIDIIVDGVLRLLEMPKIKPREDLKISNTSLLYSKLFKQHES
jgi:glycosyltransferase involved in cell wall biosynthesis